MAAQRGISVIIPVYNRERYLEECIESVKSQETNFPVEIVLADDGSTDRSLEIIRSYAAQSTETKTFVFVEKPPTVSSQGAASTRNRGIAVAKYPYIAFLDSDDVFMPGHLQRCFDYLESHPEMSIVIDQLYHATDDVNERWLAEYPYQDTVQHQLLFINAHFQMNVVLLRKDIFGQIGGAFDEELLISEDTDLALRTLESGIQIPIIAGTGSAVRNHNAERLTSGKKETIKFAYLRTAKAVARHPYPASWIRQRRAIIQYRLVRLNFSKKRYLSATGHLIAALFLNPVPAIKTVLGKWK